MLTKEEIVAKARVPKGEAALLGGKVSVRGLTLGEQEAVTISGKVRENIIPVAALCILNADGTQMFTEDELRELGGMKLDGLVDVFEHIMELSGGKPGKQKALEKNS